MGITAVRTGCKLRGTKTTPYSRFGDLEAVWGDPQVSHSLRYLSGVNRLLQLYKQGVGQAEEAFEIYERIDETAGQIRCLNQLVWLLFDDNQLDAAENAASCGIGLISGKG
jgi:hypothetical protein